MCIRDSIQILSRRTKNNPVLIGEPGVGKTAIAEGLAQAVNAGTVPVSYTHLDVYKRQASKISCIFTGMMYYEVKGQ